MFDRASEGADNTSQDIFRSEVRSWISSNLQYVPNIGLYDEGGLVQFREWEDRIRRAGYSCMSWPQRYGGKGQPEWKDSIFAEEWELAGLPPRLNRMGLRLAGPTFLALATEAQLEAWLPSIILNDDIWCQGFSEPNAGSDLASVQTQGLVDGDNLVITGDKIWTTLGVIATKMFALVNTDREGRRHHNLTFIVIDLDDPGVSRRPLIQLHGDAGFAQFHFEEVRVPLSNIVGEINEGWRVAMTLLGFERGRDKGREASLEKALSTVVSSIGASPSAVDLERLGTLAAWSYAYRQGSVEAGEVAAAGGLLGVIPNVLKLLWSEYLHQIYEEVWRIQGEDAETIEGSDAFGPWTGWVREYWHARASKIFAGTNQIQKNIIAEAGLGLPKEIQYWGKRGDSK